jgi:hypothetical protein
VRCQTSHFVSLINDILYSISLLCSAVGLNSFIRIVDQLLQDTQERLVYRAHIYISTDIRNYNPGPGDLAYPEKLEMMEVSCELKNMHGFRLNSLNVS